MDSRRKTGAQKMTLNIPFVGALSLNKTSFILLNCISMCAKAPCHYVFLATLTGLHNHIGQLFHLVLPPHIVENWQWLEALGDAAWLG